MFANIFFSKNKVQAFRSEFNSAKGTGDHVPFIKSYILNDHSTPPKTLIGIRIYYVPAEDVKAGKINEEKYEREAFVGLLPEDAFKFKKRIDKFLFEISKKENYVK